MEGLGWGAVAALAVGANGLAVAVAGRRIGSLWTTSVSIVIAFVFLCVYATEAGLHFHIAGHEWVVVALLAGASAGFLLASYHSLSLGPIAVVSPVSATSGGVTALAAFALVGERPSVSQWCGIGAAAAGAVLISSRRSTQGRLRLVGPGPLFAVLGVVMVAISNAGLVMPIRTMGPVQAITALRGITVVYVWLLLSAVFLARHRRTLPVGGGPGEAQSQERRLGRSQPIVVVLALLTVVGLLDALSFVSYARGVAVAPAWLITLVSQTGRGVSVAGGIVMFHERLSRRQWVGAALLASGVVLAVL